MGKAEGQKELWHGHVTAVTVAPQYRRLGVAKQLMDNLETVCLRDFEYAARSERLIFRLLCSTNAICTISALKKQCNT